MAKSNTGSSSPPMRLGRGITAVWRVPFFAALLGAVLLAAAALHLNHSLRALVGTRAIERSLQVGLSDLAFYGVLYLLGSSALVAGYARRQLLKTVRSYHGALAVTYEQAVALDEKSQALAGLNDSLERRVEERTRELNARAQELVGVNEVLNASREKVRRSHEELVQVIDRMPVGVLVVRGERLLFANPSIRETLGRHVHPERQSSWIDWVHPDDREVMRQRVVQGAEPGAAFSPSEVRWLRADGTVMALDLAPVRQIQFHEAPATLFVGRDITEQKRLLAELQLADRMASISHLAAAVSHEINNPLASVLANLELSRELIRGIAAAHPALSLGELPEMVAEAHDAAERVKGTVRDIAVSARGQDDRRAPVALAPLLESAIKMAWNEIKHRSCLTREFQPVPPVLAREQHLCQAFLNLLVNAAQAIPEGRVEENEIRVVLRPDGEHVLIEVHDTGSGIEPGFLGRIFDPFFTTKALGAGTGLGLSICQSVVSDHGGEISVESQLGAGSVFRLRFPVALDQVAEVPAAAAGLPPMRRGRVLVVDDEELVVNSLRRALEREQDVVVETSAKQALHRLLNERFDVVFCDLMMPELSGVDLFHHAERVNPELAAKFIFVTGGTFTAQTSAFLRSTPLPRLDKPFEVGQVRAMARALIGRDAKPAESAAASAPGIWMKAGPTPEVPQS